MRILLAVSALLLPTPLLAEEGTQPHTAPITIGTTYLVDYADGDQRQVNVYLPDGYAQGDETYPVLYLIDGGLNQDFLHVTGTTALNALWGRSQPVIVVGIQTDDRRAELIGDRGNAEEQEAFPTAGDAAEFRAFIRDTVKPLVEANYRTSGDDAVMGESLAGLFIAETWLVEPDLFDKYAAINASLWWHDVALGKSAASRVKDGQMRGPILLSYSNEGPMTEKGVRLVAAAAGGQGCLLPRGDLTHATAYHILTPQVLQFLFPTEYDLDEEWGFTVPCAG
ncbi:MAG: alpha/beta hydrolase [Erythrobacter sp.]|nr:alpha/beta hydrolase [Erythrobacter sp.]NCQ63628.1 alpha/beta hydrolase [Alphaproteobacteria bacterium]